MKISQWKQTSGPKGHITCTWVQCATFFDRLASSRFDGPIHPMADLEVFFPMNFFWWFLFRGHSRMILAWLPLRQPWANFFIGEIPRWPPNDVLHIRNLYLFHKTWSVIHVIRGFRGQGIHFWWYYAHLILSKPLFWTRGQNGAILLYGNRKFHIEQNVWSVIEINTSSYKFW